MQLLNRQTLWFPLSQPPRGETGYPTDGDKLNANHGGMVAHKTYKMAIAANTIDPTLVPIMQRKAYVESIVLNDSSIDLFGTKLIFADQSHSLPPGTHIQIRLDRYFVCSAVSDIESDRQKSEIALQDKVQNEKDRLNSLRNEAATFNASLSIPGKWVPGIKQVKSGLHGESWGDGRYRLTVEHVYLLEDLHVGRLKRKQGDYLCSASKSKWNTGWSDPIAQHVDGEGNTYEPRVTCKECLRIIKRLDTSSIEASKE